MMVVILLLMGILLLVLSPLVIVGVCSAMTVAHHLLRLLAILIPATRLLILMMPSTGWLMLAEVAQIPLIVITNTALLLLVEVWAGKRRCMVLLLVLMASP